jgi:hypothetical protein
MFYRIYSRGWGNWGDFGVLILKNRWFAKFAKKERISDACLRQAVMDAEAGKIDADYGGGVIKQRIARPNEGKSGGYRSIILFRKGNRAFFVYGFPKKEREDITDFEERKFKEFAKLAFALSDADLARLIEIGTYQEVKRDG